MKLHQDTIKTLITADQLAARVAELGAQITADLKDSERPLFVCNLRGASVFFGHKAVLLWGEYR